MVKIAQRYLEVDPWRVVEKGFHPKQSRVSNPSLPWPMSIWGSGVTSEEGYGGTN